MKESTGQIPGMETETSILPRTWRWTEHVGTWLTLAYLALIAVGMFHSALGYRHFGINILDFTEASDFLLAPFRDVWMLLVTVVPVILAWMYLSLVARLGERAEQKRVAAGRPNRWWNGSEALNARLKKWFPLFKVGLGLFWLYVSASSYQRIRAYRTMRGDGVQVRVELTDGSVMEGATNRPLMLVGSTSRYAFLFRTDEWRTEILPVENVQRIVPLGALPPKSLERRERVHTRLDSLSTAAKL